MDYKHRVPGNQKRAGRRAAGFPVWLKSPYVFTGAVVVVLLGVWGSFRSSAKHDEAKPSSAEVTSIQQPIQVPPMDARTSAKGDKKGETELEKNAANLTAKQGEPKHPVKPEAKDAHTEQVAANDKTEKQPNPPPEIRFTFYKILPEKEVIIPESEIKDLKRDEKLGLPKPQLYEIQVGSFNTLAEAEKTKAGLSQLKVRSKIETVKLEGMEWHRVKIGPFDKVIEVDRVRDYLKENQISTIVQKSTGK